jgi:hypothetical protein
LAARRTGSSGIWLIAAIGASERAHGLARPRSPPAPSAEGTTAAINSTTTLDDDQSHRDRKHSASAFPPRAVADPASARVAHRRPQPIHLTAHVVVGAARQP